MGYLEYIGSVLLSIGLTEAWASERLALFKIYLEQAQKI